MSRQSRASHNSRPASSHQSVNQQLTTSYSPPPNAESVAGTSDLYLSRYDYGRVRESRNVLGKYLTSRGRQERRERRERRENKEFANSLQERERNGGWYQYDREREEERRPQRQRLQKKNREEERARQRNNLKRKERIQEGEVLRDNYWYREGEGLEEESQPLRLFSASERSFDVQGEDNWRWALGSTYQSESNPVVPLCDRVGSRPPIPLPGHRPSEPQLHRLAPSSPSSQSSQPSWPPRFTPQSTQSPPLPHRRRRPAPSRRRRPALSPPYDTNTLPRTKIEHNLPPP
ncbi:uncharacterized protein EAF02_010639 [Botrytis sinoallii]|uniref:uncharacterized protein n=1 Tax=Botrytis sinoallii TaxID=1463999 RepID=UPI001901ECB5|nr:uncharacterized protein EAF02_010639 [Botrytis sinoallii]KAF7861685.1 hypothetical protein EAF02_010639 [Botrytis sinoallii]